MPFRLRKRSHHALPRLDGIDHDTRLTKPVAIVVVILCADHFDRVLQQCNTGDLGPA
jgi:hypothetical protein